MMPNVECTRFGRTQTPSSYYYYNYYHYYYY